MQATAGNPAEFCSTAVCNLTVIGLEDVLEDEAPAPAPRQEPEEYFDEDDEVPFLSCSGRPRSWHCCCADATAQSGLCPTC